MINRPLNIPGRRKVVTKNMILEAQKHTKSNMAAAKWMGIHYSTYKKYAKMYGVFEQHLNQYGNGIKKGFAMRTVIVEDIVLGKRQPPQRWSQSVVKEELIDKGYWKNEWLEMLKAAKQYENKHRDGTEYAVQQHSY